MGNEIQVTLQADSQVVIECYANTANPQMMDVETIGEFTGTGFHKLMTMSNGQDNYTFSTEQPQTLNFFFYTQGSGDQWFPVSSVSGPKEVTSNGVTTITAVAQDMQLQITVTPLSSTGTPST